MTDFEPQTRQLTDYPVRTTGYAPRAYRSLADSRDRSDAPTTKEFSLEELEIKVRSELDKLNDLPIIKEGKLATRSIPNIFPYHKGHNNMDYFTSPLHDIVLLILYTRDVLKIDVVDGIELNDEFMKLSAIAVVYHDVGIDGKYKFKDHERRSADIVSAAMLEHGYSPGQIESVARAILYNTIENCGQTEAPIDVLTRFLMDADYANLGRTDNIFQTARVYKERRNLEQGITELRVKQDTLQLMQRHRWKTEAGRALYQRQKEINMKRVKEAIEAS